MKILASADHHFAEGHRFTECLRVHDAMAAIVEQEMPDAFLSAGDIYDRASSPRERIEVASWLQRIADVCPVFVVRGNHDRPRDIELLGELNSHHPIRVEERSGMIGLMGLSIAMLAWPSRAALAQAAGEAASGEGLDLVARECLATVLRDFASRWPETGPRVLLTHAMIDGSVTSTGQPLVGCDMNISLSELALANADAIVAGHIHRPQEWCIGETPVLYTGSPYRTAFGELEEKSLIKIVFHERIPTVTRIPLPAQGMLLLENRWLPDVGWEETHEQSPCGCEVRWRYRVDADHRAAARDSALAMKSLLETRGADRVVIEEQVIANARARVSEISSAHTLAQKLDALWSCKGSTPDHVRRAELIRKADQLDQEVRNAL